MKREAINHTKMRRLARALGIELWGARGIMESLWYVTRDEAPSGDIGKLSDQDIADAIGWTGDPSELIRSLVQTRWLDTTPTYRVVIHDWPDHCEDHIHAKLARAGLRFADGSIPNINKLSKPDREKYRAATFSMPEPISERPLAADHTAPLAVCEVITADHKVNTADYEANMETSQLRTLPDLTKPDLAQPHTTAGNISQVRPIRAIPPIDPVVEAFNGWIEPWTRVADRDSALRMWISTVTEDTVQSAFDCRDRYLASAEVARGAVTEPWRFISTQSKNKWSGKWESPRDQPNIERPKNFSDSVQRAMQRRIDAGMEPM